MLTKKIGLLMGGESSERAVSLNTGKAIKAALNSLNYDVIVIDPQNQNYIEQLKTVNLVFNALHGTYGEDGLIQGLLECLKIPYTGTSVTGSAIAMDKVYSRVVLQQYGIPIMPFQQIDTIDEIDALEFQTATIIKPLNEGSSVGISLIETPDQLKQVATETLEKFGSILVEPYIKGQEVQIAVLNGKALGGVEIRPKNKFYDYEAKYISHDTEYILPPTISQEQLKELMHYSELCYTKLQCNGVIRVDFIIQNDTIYLLEMNTLPGMTETSLVPKIAAKAGVTFEQLCDTILSSATLHQR